MSNKTEKVVVLGASAQPEKYSYRAVQMLLEHGHLPYPVHPSGRSIGEVPTLKSLSEVRDQIDTVTMYVGPKLSAELGPAILALNPRRIIMNPGAENPELKKSAEERGIEVVEGCTLVMLRTGQY